MNAPSENPFNDPAGRQLVEDIHERKHLEGILERLAKATPGPWAIEDDDGFGHAVYKPGGWGTMYICEGLNQGHDDGLNDAEFIANAPTDIAYLLEQLQKRDTALSSVLQLAAMWEGRGEHDMAYSKTIPDEDIAIEILANGAQMVENARHIRNALKPTPTLAEGETR